jgi:hypothetical protein
MRVLGANMELMLFVCDICGCFPNGNVAPSTVGTWWWVAVKEQLTEIDAAQLPFLYE